MGKSVPSTRQITKRSSEKKTVSCECPPPVVAYTRWGNSSCPFGSTTIYQGVATGGYFNHDGAPANMLCLPPDPVRPSNDLEDQFQLISNWRSYQSC